LSQFPTLHEFKPKLEGDFCTHLLGGKNPHKNEIQDLIPKQEKITKQLT